MIISMVCFFLLIFTRVDIFAQAKIPYDEPPIYAREQSGEVPVYVGDYQDQGYLLIEKRNSTVTKVSNRTGEKTSYEFTEFRPVPWVGHYLSFSTNMDGTLFNFIPEDNILLFGYKRNTLIILELSASQKDELLREMRR